MNNIAVSDEADLTMFLASVSVGVIFCAIPTVYVLCMGSATIATLALIVFGSQLAMKD